METKVTIFSIYPNGTPLGRNWAEPPELLVGWSKFQTMGTGRGLWEESWDDEVGSEDEGVEPGNTEINLIG